MSSGPRCRWSGSGCASLQDRNHRAAREGGQDASTPIGSTDGTEPLTRRRSGFGYPFGPMDGQSTFLLALGLPIAVAAFAPASGWILFMGDRGAGRAPATPDHHEAAEGH